MNDAEIAENNRILLGLQARWRADVERLQAEVERLRNKCEIEEAMRADLVAEVERLRAEMLEYEGRERFDRTEVERLRASAKAWEADALLRETNRTDLEAEVERLRHDNDKYGRDMNLLGAEVERLREEHRDTKAQLWNRTHQADALRAACDKSLAEVERLRALYQASEKERTVYRAEVERLRAALERVESILRPIASDNPVYERTTAHFDAHGIARAALVKEEA